MSVDDLAATKSKNDGIFHDPLLSSNKQATGCDIVFAESKM